MVLNNKAIYELILNYKYNSPEIFFNDTDTKSCKFPEVFIYASGKTASTSVYQGFQQLNISCVHLHNSQYFIKRVLKLNEGWSNFVMMDYINYLTNFDEDILVFDAVREPISRKISAFFQHFERLDYNYYGFTTKKEMLNFYKENVELLIEEFNSSFLLQREDYYGFDEYIDDGLSVREIDFDHHNKRIYLRHNYKQYLILRFEDISSWEHIFREIGYKGFELPHENQSAQKRTASIYKEFKKEYYISKEQLDSIYFGKHQSVLEHFYTTNEIEVFYKKWLQRVR